MDDNNKSDELLRDARSGASAQSTSGLYRLANQSVGDVLKVAKNGNFRGAFKTAEGKHYPSLRFMCPAM